MSDLLFHRILGRGGEAMPPVEDDFFVWERPSEWPDIDSLVGPTDDKFVALVSVSNDVDATDGQWVAFSFTVAAAGTYDVDWGDGTQSLGVASSAPVGKLYDPANPNLTTTSYGYKTATIVVTASNNITGYSLTLSSAQLNSVLPGNFNSASMSALPIIDCCLRLPFSSTQLGAWNNKTNIQRLRIKEGTTFGTTFSNSFFGCESLSELIIESDTSMITSTTSMFSQCRSLVNLPLFDTSNVTTSSSMFAGCWSLEKTPEFVFTSLTSANAMFTDCASLKVASVQTSTSLLDVSQMFQSCLNLRSITGLVTSSVTNFTSFLSGCNRLPELPATLDTSSGQLLNSAFANCRSFREISIDISSATNMTNTFQNCTAVRRITLTGNSASLTTLSSTFSNCSSLDEVSLFNTSAVQNFSAVFLNCHSLKSIPNFDCSGATNTGFFANSFNGCRALKAIPNLPGPATIGVSYQNTVNECWSLTRVQTAAIWPDANITLTACYSLGGEALDEIFTNLPTVVTSKNINVTACRGRNLCDPTIATAKNWTVTN
jgi:hypothetical protein